MPGDDDLIEAAKSTAVDYYDLLGITFENSSESDIRRAYRRTALKYHPDKNADKPDIVEKFHLLQIANDVLSSPEYKAIYDNARRVKQEKEERHQAFEGRRRQMKEDLENRENASLKRKHQEEEEGDKLQREIQRLAADGKRRRLERQEQLNRERLEEEERLDREKNGYISPQQSAPKTSTPGVSDIDRSVKVVWSKDGPGAEIDKDRLKVMFTTFGKLQDVAVLKEKKKRIGESKSKSLVASALIVYESVVGAHAAISDYKKRSDSDPDFKAFDSVYWASNKEPDFLQRPSTPVPSTPGPDKPSTQRPLRDIPGLDSPITPLKQSGGGLRKVPSFASFSSAKNSPVATSASSPSLEELTMIRLKNAEKRRLEEQIRKEEAGEED
ncbi:DnaJ-domain-containing protein [Aureobasidium pullulans]|nr:DnaJ-domain-containing protein [Aureobasidium pullulans]